MLYWQCDQVSSFEPFWRVTGELSRRWSQECCLLMHCPSRAQGETGGRAESVWVLHLLSGGGRLSSLKMPNLDFSVSQRSGCVSIKACNLLTGGMQSPNCLKGTLFQSLALLFVGAISCALKNCSHSWITAGTTGHKRPLCSKFCTCN